MGRKFAVICAALALCLPVAFVSRTVSAAGASDAFDIAESVRLPIVMYHDVMKSSTGRYIVSPSQLESDLSALADAGYTFVSPREVIDYAEGRSALPEKPVMITFDDGHYNNAFYGLPVFERCDAKATFCVVGEYADKYSESVKSERDNPNYSCLTWDEIRELSQSRLISIASHSYGMHALGSRKGIAPKRGESDEEYVAALTADTEKLQARMLEFTGERSDVYAYPYGLYTPLSRSTLESLGYKLMFTCNERVSVVRYGDPNSIKELGRFNREGSYSTQKLLRKLGVS